MQVTTAVSAITATLVSVRKNWMYSVWLMIRAYERRTSPRPASTGQPGWTQEISSSSHSAESASKSPCSIAS